MSAWPQGFEPPEMAIVRHDPETGTLSLVRSREFPDPRTTVPRGHVIQVCAVALTNGELGWQGPRSLGRPIPGYDFSGYVLSAPRSSPFQPGSQVYGRTAFNRPGNARSYSVALMPELGFKPKNLSWELAATVPISALTAYQALFEYLEFEPPNEWRPQYSCPRNGRRKMLITGGASSVGMWAVQLAKLSGVGHIAATCGPGNAEFVQSLGAHEVLDYTQPGGDLTKWPANRTKFDVVLDCVGGDALRGAWTVVREGGTLVSVVMPPEHRRPAEGVEKDVRPDFFVQGANSYQMEEVSYLLEAGLAKTVVGAVYPLEEAQAAMDQANRGHGRGKVVLKVNQEDPRQLIEFLGKNGRLDDRDATERMLEEADR